MVVINDANPIFALSYNNTTELNAKLTVDSNHSFHISNQTLSTNVYVTDANNGLYITGAPGKDESTLQYYGGHIHIQGGHGSDSNVAGFGGSGGHVYINGGTIGLRSNSASEGGIVQIIGGHNSTASSSSVKSAPVVIGATNTKHRASPVHIEGHALYIGGPDSAISKFNALPPINSPSGNVYRYLIIHDTTGQVFRGALIP